MGGKGHPRRSFLLAAGIAGGLATVAASQEGLGGKTLRLTLGQSLQYSDNIDLVANPDNDGVLRSSTRLGLSYSDVTRTQSFRFNTGGAYEIDSDGESGLNDPFATLSYALTGANSRLNFSADYRETDLDDVFASQALIPVTDGDGDADPVPDAGTPVNDVAQIENGDRINTSYGIGFETGLQSTVGLQLNFLERARRFSGVVDPDLFETRDRRADLRLTFRIDPQITARFTASGRRFTAEDTDGIDRTETSAGVGVTFNLTPVTTLDLSLGYSRTEVERNTGDTIADGITYGGTLSRVLPNGTIGVDFSSTETTNGRRNTLRANRAMTLPRDATLSYGIGVSKTDGFSSEPLFTLAYAKPLKRGRFGLAFSQEARTDEEEDDAVILTQLSANYALALSPTVNWLVSAGLNDVSAKSDTGEDRRRINLSSNLNGQINDVSSWSAGITFSETDTSSALDDEEQRRYGVQLAYRRALAREWDMVARYQHTSIVDSDAEDRRSNAVSLGLEKTFSFRP